MTEPDKTGFLQRTKNFAQDKYAEGKAKKEAAVEAERAFHEYAERKYGRLVANESFGQRRIELYEGGYVRVIGMFTNLKVVTAEDLMSKDFVVPRETPFEKLRAIKASTQVQDKSAGGRALASAATMGLSKLASNENRFLFLTISTDRETYSLREKGGRSRDADQVPMRLELAGQGILDALASKNAATPAPLASGPTPPSVADQLRDLAGLHQDGVLSDDEFAAAKAKLLGT
ncbi:MAG TPA: SHOCT domain-containing protein [Mycobacteriales bacterium]|nr:SHOCT domain-containing protein [Mycobacteriales bacterium]